MTQPPRSKLKKLKLLNKVSKKLITCTTALDSIPQSLTQPTPPPSTYFSQDQFSSLQILPETKSAITNILHYSQLTQIQSKCIPHLLKGRDLLGSAKTGSGKTLAFLIPAIELLAKSHFTPKHGTGVIIISPTRELAWQTFTKVNELVTYQSRTHGLLIGGVNRKIEAERLKKGMNIIVATPGRLLDHLENTKGFAVHNLLCLVIDEADALLKIGFEEEMNRIIQLLPSERQTVLFSATQTKQVDKLARLSLKQPVYVGVDDSDEVATVEHLEQGFVICQSDKRFLLLFTLVQRFSKQKVMVFFSSCNSVKFYSDLFNYVDVPVLEIHGKQKQTKRQNTFFEFCNAEVNQQDMIIVFQKGVLFCTDIAARGLDIQAVDWIIQYDPPDDTKEYIHRVGRTCRGADALGKALIFLLPSELEYLKHLRMAKVTLNEYEFPQEKLANIQSQFDKLIERNYYLHKAAFEGYKSYLHAYASHALKDVFDVNKLDLEKVGRSYNFYLILVKQFERFGFTVPPRVNLNVKVSGKTVRQNKIMSFKGGSKSLLYKGRDRHLIQKAKSDPDRRQFSR